jgi:DNA repair protein RecN (Recombination protein N)
MIQSLYIRNYVLIDELEMQFSGGFTTITGETGAGKSILMGALSLILGQRVDTSVLKLKDAKCIVEGTFQPGEIVRKVFQENDLDFETITTLRREIAPGGKSRAFVNDTPVNLPLLKEIGKRLVDIHSQHQNLQLNDHLYQLEVIDHLAGNKSDLKKYQTTYVEYNRVGDELQRLRKEMEGLKAELDFMQFQFNELDAAHLRDGEMEELEAELQRAEHQEEIRSALFNSAGLLSGETTGILDQLKDALDQQQKISSYFSPAKEVADRMKSAYIELKDLASEVLKQAEKSDVEPG